MGNFSESNPIDLNGRIQALETAVQADEILYAAFLESPKGDDIYVDPAGGSDTNGGGSWTLPLKTFAKASEKLTDFAKVHFFGTISEDTQAIVNAGVRVIGEGPRGSNVWENATADKTLLSIGAAGVQLINFKIRPPIYSAGVPKGLALSGANYLGLFGMRFQGRAGSWYAIYSDVSSDNVLLEDCEFLFMNTASNGYAIYGVAAVAGNTHSAWRIRKCLFEGNVNNYVAPSKSCVIEECTMPDYGLGPLGAQIQTTTKINVSGTNAGYNQVHKSILGGGALSHAHGYYGVATNDNWSGNQLDDATLSASTPPTS